MTVFEGTPIYRGLTGDNARVMRIEDRVLIRAVDIVAEEGVTIAMTPAQARDFAMAIVFAADKAEGR